MFLRQRIDCYVAQGVHLSFPTVYPCVRRLKKRVYRPRTRTSGLMSEKRYGRIAHLVTTRGEGPHEITNDELVVSSNIHTTVYFPPIFYTLFNVFQIQTRCYEYCLFTSTAVRSKRMSRLLENRFPLRV